MTARAGRFVVDGKGRRSAVILPIQDYERLLEDLRDLAVVAERRQETPIDLAEIRRRLKRRASV
ncbi:MAG: type II toxin-antitoxin system Phd/YefM family antitoxin [Euryarchaeota archaeon]|nr:type II toxin-antitoxin system Phd/YefM family antitoxin [Euryarchaeota archaeon]